MPPVIEELIARSDGRLRFVWRHLPLTDVHPNAAPAAEASEAAAAQGRFWEMHTLLFHHQDQLTFEDLVGYAGELGLNVEDFVRDMQEERHAERIREDVASAEALLKAGANPNWPGPGGVTPMSIAREREDAAVLKLLERYGIK